MGVQAGEQIYVCITDNVSPANNPRLLTTAYDHDPRILGRSIMDQFEYVMYGKVYKKDDNKKRQQCGGACIVWRAAHEIAERLRPVKGGSCDRLHLLARAESTDLKIIQLSCILPTFPDHIIQPQV